MDYENPTQGSGYDMYYDGFSDEMTIAGQKAAVLTSLGGIIGVVSGVGLAELISNMM